MDVNGFRYAVREDRTHITALTAAPVLMHG
jgi:hypothetical protein